jgi:hypothetical protein
MDSRLIRLLSTKHQKVQIVLIGNENERKKKGFFFHNLSKKVKLEKENNLHCAHVLAKIVSNCECGS